MLVGQGEELPHRLGPGFAHGFVVLSESAQFLYKTTDYWFPEFERSIVWNDPEIGIASLTAHPVTHVRTTNPGLLPHSGVRHPLALFEPARRNSRGFDFADEHALAELGQALRSSGRRLWRNNRRSQWRARLER